ncbi:hypothetical protein NDU88_000784 [Pleurodeles waltl]|uniref:Uncharacterized protein n=1 Tax=Pleurodeles waltl TaxID=8319 RepID=A0AAV7WK05_PLEWA|nr:hypothetical protein NDU88_000784 [Pleurodeles waltl]
MALTGMLDPYPIESLGLLHSDRKPGGRSVHKKPESPCALRPCAQRALCANTGAAAPPGLPRNHSSPSTLGAYAFRKAAWTRVWQVKGKVHKQCVVGGTGLPIMYSAFPQFIHIALLLCLGAAKPSPVLPKTADSPGGKLALG